MSTFQSRQEQNQWQIKVLWKSSFCVWTLLILYPGAIYALGFVVVRDKIIRLDWAFNQFNIFIDFFFWARGLIITYTLTFSITGSKFFICLLCIKSSTVWILNLIFTPILLVHISVTGVECFPFGSPWKAGLKNW